MEPEKPLEQRSVEQEHADSAAKAQADSKVDKWWLSGSSDEEDNSKSPRKQSINNDDLLYDPDADDEDEKWAQEQRKGHVTDAILSCPGCFTTLCIDCQQHAHYHTQYRAMITMNCEVKTDQPMHSQVQRQTKQQQQQRRKRQAPDGYEDTAQQQQQQQQGTAANQQQQGDDEVLYPVCCAVCDTQVGAQDAEGMVHFFHVLASEC